MVERCQRFQLPNKCFNDLKRSNSFFWGDFPRDRNGAIVKFHGTASVRLAWGLRCQPRHQELLHKKQLELPQTALGFQKTKAWTICWNFLLRFPCFFSFWTSIQVYSIHALQGHVFQHYHHESSWLDFFLQGMAFTNFCIHAMIPNKDPWIHAPWHSFATYPSGAGAFAIEVDAWTKKNEEKNNRWIKF